MATLWPRGCGWCPWKCSNMWHWWLFYGSSIHLKDKGGRFCRRCKNNRISADCFRRFGKAGRRERILSRWVAVRRTLRLERDEIFLYIGNIKMAPFMLLKCKNIAKGTTDPRHWVLWLIQQLYFKVEASTSFEILVKHQLGFVSAKGEKTLKNFDKSV